MDTDENGNYYCSPSCWTVVKLFPFILLHQNFEDDNVQAL